MIRGNFLQEYHGELSLPRAADRFS